MTNTLNKVTSDIKNNSELFMDKDLRVKLHLTKKLGKSFVHGKGKRKKKKK